MLIGSAIVVVLIVIALLIVRMYNRLVRSRNEVENASGTIDVQLKQRCDLIPNVVATVRGYMDHERGVLEKLTSLREQAGGVGVSIEQRAALDAQMAGLLRGLMARVEAYPQLKASEPVLQLQRSLNEVEAQIAAARRTYNSAATAYNVVVETVPTNMMAGAFGFGRRPLFEAGAEDRAVPRVAGLM